MIMTEKQESGSHLWPADHLWTHFSRFTFEIKHKAHALMPQFDMVCLCFYICVVCVTDEWYKLQMCGLCFKPIHMTSDRVKQLGKYMKLETTACVINLGYKKGSISDKFQNKDNNHCFHCC